MNSNDSAPPPRSDHEAASKSRIAAVAVLVHDYDDAIEFFTRALRFRLLEDTPLEDGKRWVRVAPSHGSSALLLARAVGPAQQRAVGDQSGGRVMFFLESDDFWADYEHMQAHGVRFLEAPRHESYGWVVVFLDVCGNRWDLLQRRS